MTPVEWVPFLRQVNSLAGCLTGLGLLFLNRYLPGLLFLAMGLSHLLAELRHTPYRL